MRTKIKTIERFSFAGKGTVSGNIALDLLDAIDLIKEMREALQWVQKTQKSNYGHATDLHLDMLDFPRKYDNVLKKSKDYAE